MNNQVKLTETKWREVPFEIMLKCDGDIKCECWLLSNSINKYGVDLRQPMALADFLRLIPGCETESDRANLEVVE